MKKKFSYNLKVFYEDTDVGGVVYYANYLKFFERARSEAIKSLGFTNTKLLKNYKILIIVKSCNIDYLAPSKLEDKLKVISEIKEVKRSSFKMLQIIKKNNITITIAEILLVCVNQKGKPVKIPNVLLKKLN
tara:strand:+ start:52 stop:447 length:396 start_codon:yes stop_codon:yes gene_type:complete